MARMGQCFSTSLDTVGVETSEEEMYTEETDVFTANNDYCFSDGVGRISQDLAVEVILGTWRLYNFCSHLCHEFCMSWSVVEES